MGAAEQIISLMPRHRVYLEGFGGTGAVFFKKRPAWMNVIIEKDGDTAAQLAAAMKAFEMSRAADGGRFLVRRADIFDYLSMALPVNPQVSPEPGAASPTSAGSGRNSSTAVGELAPDGSWQKILLDSLASSLEESSGSSGSWKQWASKSVPSSLVLWTWVPLTVERGYSLWPTPVAKTAQQGKCGESFEAKRRRGTKPGWNIVDVLGFMPHPEFLEWLMGFPIGWTEHPLSVTQLSLALHPSLEKPSCE